MDSMSEEPTVQAKPGLEGVVAGDTAICCVEQGTLTYRGYAIGDLAGKVCFEEVAHLLLFQELPTEAELKDFRKVLDSHRGLPKPVVDALRTIPPAVPMMDVLRTGVSMMGHFDPISGHTQDDLWERSICLLAVVSDIVSARFRLKNGQSPLQPKPGLSHAAQFLYVCHGTEPDATATQVLDLTLILYAEHEFNASTFTDRVIASTMSDMVSAVVGAIGALKGPLHGGANEQAMQLILRFKTAAEASKWVNEALARKEKVMGFGTACTNTGIIVPTFSKRKCGNWRSKREGRTCSPCTTRSRRRS